MCLNIIVILYTAILMGSQLFSELHLENSVGSGVTSQVFELQMSIINSNLNLLLEIR